MNSVEMDNAIANSVPSLTPEVTYLCGGNCSVS